LGWGLYSQTDDVKYPKRQIILHTRPARSFIICRDQNRNRRNINHQIGYI